MINDPALSPVDLTLSEIKKMIINTKGSDYIYQEIPALEFESRFGVDSELMIRVIKKGEK